MSPPLKRLKTAVTVCSQPPSEERRDAIQKLCSPKEWDVKQKIKAQKRNTEELHTALVKELITMGRSLHKRQKTKTSIFAPVLKSEPLESAQSSAAKPAVASNPEKERAAINEVPHTDTLQSTAQKHANDTTRQEEATTQDLGTSIEDLAGAAEAMRFPPQDCAIMQLPGKPWGSMAMIPKTALH